MSLLKRFEVSIAIAVVTSVIFSVISFSATAEEIRNDVLRLHVIAASDSEEDQKLKLEVRDAVLDAGAEIFDGSVNVKNAVAKISPQINILTESARKVIKEHGFDYSVEITVDEEYFTTRTYKSVTLPAGEYLSLIVRIGEGEGKNWWCVMFPPMCLSAADEEDVLKSVLSDNEIKLVTSSPKFEPRFKVIEIFENIKSRIKT